MGMRNMMILNKDDKRYLCRIVEYSPHSSKIRIQVLGENTLRYCNIFQNDIIKVEVPIGDKVTYFKTKVLYRDKIDHYIVIEKPSEGTVDNRRKDKRIDVHMKLRITKGNTDVEEQVSLMGYQESNAIIFDISYGGMGIYASYQFEKGDELEFTFSLPGGKILEDIKGFVVVARHSDYENISKYGIKFEDLTKLHQAHLEEFLNRYNDEEEEEEDALSAELLSVNEL